MAATKKVELVAIKPIKMQEVKLTRRGQLRYLRFVSPLFIRQPKKRPPLSNGRKRIVMRKDGGRK